jgi:hypothetical protein
MPLKTMFTESIIASYFRTIRSCPREIIANRQLLLTVAMYATAGLPISECLFTYKSRDSL